MESMNNIQSRMGGVEQQVIQKVGQTLNLIQAVSEKQIAHAQQLREMDAKLESQKLQQQQQVTTIEDAIRPLGAWKDWKPKDQGGTQATSTRRPAKGTVSS